MENKINNYLEYKAKIAALFNGKYDLPESASKIIELGYCISRDVQTDNIDVLIVGMNPSEGGGPGEYPSFDESITNPDGVYWHAIKRYLCDEYKFEHVDLFALRETHQYFLAQVGDNHNALDFLSKQLFLTQQLIELIKPKLIIVANKAAFAYWGKLPEYTWMGYSYKPIKSEINSVERDLELMEISGLSKKNQPPIGKLLCPDFETNLVGTKILFARYQANGCPKSKQITKSDIEYIFKHHID